MCCIKATILKLQYVFTEDFYVGITNLSPYAPLSY